LKKGKHFSEQYIENLVMDKKIEVIFVLFSPLDLTFDIYFLEQLSKKAILVMSFFDTEYYFEAVDRYYAQVADLVLIGGYLEYCKYECLDINAYSCFSVHSSDHYKNNHILSKDIDVSFVGNFDRTDRMEYVNYLKAAGIKVQTYGYGSDNGFVSFEDMISIFNRSKINLSFADLINSRYYKSCVIPLPAINQRQMQLKGRPIEVALCGGFVLSQYSRGLEDMFSIGKEIEVFCSKEEMLQKVQFYLANIEKRTEIAENSYQRALSQYEAKIKFQIIFDKLKNLPPKKSYPLYFDDIFLRIYASYRFYYLSRYLLSGSFFLFFKELCVLMKRPKIIIYTSCYFVALGCHLKFKKNFFYKKLLTYFKNRRWRTVRKLR
jgi:hypothetical protein